MSYVSNSVSYEYISTERYDHLTAPGIELDEDVITALVSIIHVR